MPFILGGLLLLVTIIYILSQAGESMSTSGKLQPSKKTEVYQAIVNKYKSYYSKYVTTGLPDSLVLAIIAQESGGVEKARGSSGEYGIFQIMPFHFTKEEPASMRFDPSVQFKVFNRVTADIISALRKKNMYTPENFLASYNAGVGGMLKGRSKDYAKSVLNHQKNILGLP